MFYQRDSINRHLICPICSEKFHDPRILPCGQSACNECVSNFKVTDQKKEIKCTLCNENHCIPEPGFIVNQTILNLQAEKAEEVYRSKSVKLFRDKLNLLRDEIDEFERNLENGVDQIKDHCMKLRNRVDLATEELIEEVHKFNEKLIDEIKEYEKECISSFNNDQYSNEKFMQLVKEVDQFYSKKNHDLSTRFSIDDIEIEEASRFADDYMKRLKSEKDKLEKAKFSNRILQFDKTVALFDSNLIGSLKHKAFNLDMSDYNSINILTDLIRFNYQNLLRLKSGNFAVFFADAEFCLNAVILDENGKSLVQRTNMSGNHVSELRAVEFGDKILVYFHQQNAANYWARSISKVSQISHNSNVLAAFSSVNLNYIKHLDLNIKFNDISANNLNLFGMSYYRDLCIYDLNMKVVNKLVAGDAFISSAISIEVNDVHLFCLYQSSSTFKIRVFNIETSRLVTEIQLNENFGQMKVSNDFLIFFMNQSNTIYYYGHKGEFKLVREREVSRKILDRHMFLARDKTDTISMFNGNKLCFSSL